MQDLKQRTFEFTVAVGRLIQQIPFNAVNKAYTNQLIRCSSSVAANYRAARRAKSAADFINKLKIVEEEADESVYFLELLLIFNPGFKEQITILINEANALLKIIVASIKTARSTLNKDSK